MKVIKNTEPRQSIAMPDLPAHGDYVCSEQNLFYVEYVDTERAVLEDCRTSALLAVSLADLARLRSVTPA